MRNPVGLSGTIPEELWDAARDIAAYRFLSESGGDELISKAREIRYQAGEKKLREAAEGTLKIVPPENFAPVQAQSPSPKIKVPKRRYQPGNFDGV